MPSINELPLIPATRADIPNKSNPNSRSLRAVIVTANEKKFQEFRSQLGDGYGMEVQQFSPADDLNSEPDMLLLCEKIMGELKFSPHFILREQTSLESISRHEDLTHLSLEDIAKRELENVLHISRLSVYKPQWTGDQEKKLTGFTLKNFEKRSYGYIKPHSNLNKCEQGFGWDAIFVNAATNLTNEEFFTKYGKKSARQHVTSDFIESYLRYKALSSLQHHKLPIKRPVDFGQDYFHLTTFVKEEKHLSNPFIHQWGIEKLRNAVINDGLFIKAAWSRPVKNYFSPPFSGLPLTAKKDDAEETIFMTHDMLHHLIPDLVCDKNAAKEHFFVYNAWRMASEACTLVLADMLYADGLIQSGVERECVDKRIYPLFEAVKDAQQLPHPDDMTNEEKTSLLRKLLFANIQYALLGDDSEWQKLLKYKHGDKLKAYKDHFEKFFIGDNAWTRANFENMHKHPETLHTWIDRVGKDTFRASNIPLLSDVYNQLEARKVSMIQYRDVVNAVFELIFETRIKPHLQQNEVKFEPDAVVQSRAFRRYLIGQASLFSRFPVPLNLDYIPQHIFTRLQSDELFSNTEQDEIRQRLEQYISGIKGLGVMSEEEALNAKDCATVFPPVYITYPAMKEKYHTIINCFYNCTQIYESQDSASPTFTRVIDGITFIDAVALEESISKEIPAKDRLRQKMINAGVWFWDYDKATIVEKPVVGISSIGGLPINLAGNVPEGMIRLGSQAPATPQSIANDLRINMGMQSTHTYMNPNGKRPRELYDVTVGHKHYSITHAAQIGISIFGLSTKAELEFDVQRDKLHLARQTSARDASQDEPCLVAMSAEEARVTEKIRDLTTQTLASFQKSGSARDWREARNALYPKSAATSLGLNGTLRNFSAVVADIGGDGKELEYRNLLGLINDSLSGLFPELFKPTLEYTKTAKTISSLTQPRLTLFSPAPRVEKKSKDAILLLGAPCVGKSTQLARIIEQYPNTLCISSGELVRKLDAKIKDGQQSLTDIERRAAESLDIMRRGGLMNTEAVYDLVMAHLSPGGAGHEDLLRADLIILDGIVKAEEHIEIFKSALQKFNDKAPVTLSPKSVINLHATENDLIARFGNRVLDATQKGQAQRSDDEIEIYRNRLTSYLAENPAILNYYRQHLCVIDIDTSQGKDQTTRELLEAIAQTTGQSFVQASTVSNKF